MFQDTPAQAKSIEKKDGVFRAGFSKLFCWWFGLEIQLHNFPPLSLKNRRCRDVGFSIFSVFFGQEDPGKAEMPATSTVRKSSPL